MRVKRRYLLSPLSRLYPLAYLFHHLQNLFDNFYLFKVTGIQINFHACLGMEIPTLLNSELGIKLTDLANHFVNVSDISPPLAPLKQPPLPLQKVIENRWMDRFIM